MSTSGSMIAHIVNNRASAAVPKRKDQTAQESDSEDDMQAILARSRKVKATQPKPVVENKKNPFDGPLPFPKLDWRKSLFAKGPTEEGKAEGGQNDVADQGTDEMGGGFEVEQPQEQDGPLPLPPWLVDNTDIRESLKKQ